MSPQRDGSGFFGIDGGRLDFANACRPAVERDGMRQHRYIIASSETRGTFLLVRANASDDGTLVARGSRSEMVALRDELLSTEAALAAAPRPRLRCVVE